HMHTVLYNDPSRFLRRPFTRGSWVVFVNKPPGPSELGSHHLTSSCYSPDIQRTPRHL
ncbi:hypothetical protein LB507_003523, partial [Fusarium sp. FIESC RH6]